MADLSLYHEKALIFKISEGDEEAFEELYRLYTPRLSSFLQGLTHSSDTTNDLIQETYLQIWLHRDKLIVVEHPKAWIFRTAANITFNYLKRKVSERNILNALSNSRTMHVEPTEEYVQLQQLKKFIKKGIDQLSPQRKKIYLLSREAGFTIPKIAHHLNLSESTVKNTLVTALQEMRDYLCKNGFKIGLILIIIFSHQKYFFID